MQIPPSQTPLIAQLNRLHGQLLILHKALLDHERARYEVRHGVVHSPYDLLQLVINDPFFNWLRTLSGLITEIDEFTSAKPPAEAAIGQALLKQTAALIVPDENGSPFQRDYFRAIQESPIVARAHDQFKRDFPESPAP